MVQAFEKTVDFEIFLFSKDLQIITEAVENGIHGIIIDMENRGKQNRQAGFDTQIKQNTYEDIEKIKTSTKAYVITRINGFWEETSSEINQVIGGGTDEIFLPMVRSVKEVESSLRFIDGKCKLSILVETLDAIEICADLNQLPLSHVYVGLNDLAIDRGLSNIFLSLADGTVERIRKNFQLPFGFGGLTLPDMGNPIPCRLLMSEMARLNTQFTFLRRSFFRDTGGKNFKTTVPRILQALNESFHRPTSDLEMDHQELVSLIGKINMDFKRDV
jgi:hypothetical protein